MTDPYRKPSERAPIAPHLRQWFTKSGDVVKGPFDIETIRSSCRAGYVKSTTLVRAEDATEWRPLADVKDLTLGASAGPRTDAAIDVESRSSNVRYVVLTSVAIGVVAVGAALASKTMQARETIGSATPAPALTQTGNPPASFPKTFAGFRFGSTIAEAAKACRVGHGAPAPDGLECDAMQAEPGIAGNFVRVGMCRGHVCEIDVHIDDEPATRYARALEALTARFGKPSTIFSTPPESERAARATCAGDATIASAMWDWSDGVDGRIVLALDCLDHRTWTWVSVANGDGTARYRNDAATP